MIANNLVATGEPHEGNLFLISVLTCAGEASSAIFDLETLLSTLLNEIVSHALVNFVDNTQAQIEVLTNVLRLF